jgi:hypothetical protein
MSDVDAVFLEVRASCAGAEGEVDYADDGWKPEDGEYTVLLEKFNTGTKEKGGVQNGWGKANFKILTGDNDGRSFCEFFWLPSSAQKCGPGMANLLRLATCLAGREFKVAEIQEAGQIINGCCGTTVLNVRIYTTTSKKDGKTYTNTRYLTLVADDEVPTE